ncbi:signal peptide peptidase SppA [Pelagicoccus sp. SDUM812002]|uniref:signal peptide peptidase SppA n=1 Tax=Pelagicoccus sp. SDUM812002 TaxID=3041266 RepID=UPI00280F8692|nr:signal peptide peptidase SppA [Pelagicoccus sp. SDUM812002]MDQ8186741.1 signal peptide peptidase SppA [Pelagicoccus sp. SDUM812002]
MKGFFKTFFASLLAIVFAAGGLALFVMILFGVIASMSQPVPQVTKGSVLVFDMSASVQDRPVGMSRDALIDEAMGGGRARSLSLLTLKRGLEAAAEDDRIEGLLLIGSFSADGYGSGFAALKEVRESIEIFKATGKAVAAYLVYPTARDMYVSSVADSMYMNPEGVISDTGMSMSYPYLGGFMKKYGIGVQVTRAGEYKAAAESFVLEGMSDPSREANAAVLEDFWAEYLDVLSEGSGVEPDRYEAKLNELGMLVAKDAQELGLVDELLYTDELIAKMQVVSSVDKESNSFVQTSLDDYLLEAVRPEYSSDGFVAVIYAEGSIVNGEGKDGQIGGSSLSREIRKVRQNDKVKAIVLRVNSPGGSALASEVIQRELRLAKEKMPVVVSMGSLAASGGYWISAYADKIYAQPNTLTGSIGVIGVFFNYEELASTHGVNFDTVKTTQHADLMGMFRAKTDREMELVQRQVDIVYESFLAKVAEGRGLELAEVARIAEGRIWSGVDALDLGLVDELGGLSDAIAYAGGEAGLGQDPAVMELPKAKNFLDELFQNVSKKTADASTNVAMQPLVDLYREASEMTSRFNDPKGVYAVLPYTVKID